MAEPFIGEVGLYGFNFVPEKWAQCEGQTIQIDSNQALFSLLGSAYGGDGRTTFAIPDMRGKVAISQGRHPGSQYEWQMGNTGGNETHTLSEQELPVHAHLASFTGTGNSDVEWVISTDAATKDGADTDGDYLARNDGGRNPGVFRYRQDPGSTVPLGGVSGGVGVSKGTVAVQDTGNAKRFNIIQTAQILNYCMALQGLFPSRS